MKGNKKEELTPFSNYVIVEGKLYYFTDEQLNDWKKDFQMDYVENFWPDSLEEDDNYDEELLMLIMNSKCLGHIPEFNFVNKSIMDMNDISIEVEEKEAKAYGKLVKKQYGK